MDKSIASVCTDIGMFSLDIVGCFFVFLVLPVDPRGVKGMMDGIVPGAGL